MQNSSFSKHCYFIALLFITISGLAQNGTNDQPSPATIRVIVTNYKQQPLKGEEVIFINAANKKKFSARTDGTGKCSLELKAGAKYLIKLKTLTDTSNYSSFEIPALQPGQFFEAPFTVNIQYEPAKSFTLDNVQFDFGKPSLRPESLKELNEIAEYMKWKEEENYEIAGHTDNVGKDEDNLKLSQSRADAVKNYLVKKGIAAARLTAKGYGSTQPVAANETPEGRQKYRRTEVHIV